MRPPRPAIRRGRTGIALALALAATVPFAPPPAGATTPTTAAATATTGSTAATARPETTPPARGVRTVATTWPTLLGSFVPPQAVGMHGMGPSAPDKGARAGSFRVAEARWDQVEMQDGDYYWPLVDAAVGDARDRGARDVLLVIGSTPEWAAEPGSAPFVTRPPRRNADWERWVRAVATRYRGQGLAYQVWNEANLSTFWTGTPEQMADLTARAFSVIRAVDPGATVVAASTTLRLPYSFSQFYPRYLAGLRSAGWPVDVFSAHTYPVSTGTPKTRQTLIRDYLDSLRQAGAPQRPVWDTEVNYGMAGPGPAYPERDINGATAARWVALTYLDSIRLGVARTYWYSQQPPDDFLGVQMWSDTPGLSAERWVYDWVVGRRWRGCNTKSTTVECRLTAAEGTSWLVWTRPGRRAATIRVPAGAAIACDALGRCSSVRAGSTLRIDGVPVRLGPSRGGSAA